MILTRSIERDTQESEWKIQECLQDFVVVIPAHNEAAVLDSTLKSLIASSDSTVQIHVIADHCSDATIAIAAGAGARVHIRDDQGPPGKGPALHWWLAKTHAQSSPEQIVLVIDADSRLSPGFIDDICTHFSNDVCVAQARIEPSISSTTPLELISSFSEIIEHRILDSLRGQLRWPVRLRGTGMIFRRELLEKYSQFLHTNVEDLELTVLLGAANVPIHYLPHIVVLDPKPQDPSGAVHQRARWLRGQFQVARDYAAHIIRIFFRGPKGWSLLGSGLLKPRTFFFPLKILSFLFSLKMACSGFGPMWHSVAILVGAAVVVELCLYILGLRYTRYRWKTFISLAALPLYLILWIQSTALAYNHRQPWLSSRRSISNPPYQRTT